MAVFSKTITIILASSSKQARIPCRWWYGNNNNSSFFSQLMTLHTFFNYPFWALLMQPPTALVGMIRHPFDQFSSFFDFFHVGRSLQTAFPFLDSHSTFDFFLNYSTQLLDGNLRNRWRNLVSRHHHHSSFRHLFFFRDVCKILTYF